MPLFPFEDSAKDLADEAEIRALAGPTSSCSLEDLKRGVRQYISFDDLGDDEEVKFSEDDRVTLLTTDAAEEITRRIQLLNGAYPFTFDGSVLTVSDRGWSQFVGYVFLLLMSANGLTGVVNGRRHFEEVVTAALGRFLDGDSLRFGWPHRGPVPTHPDQALSFLAERLQHRRIDLGRVKPADKDLGLDVIAWKAFPDGRQGQIVILGNCSTGDDWHEKLGEPSVRRWSRMIDFGGRIVTVFAIPWVPNEDDWRSIIDYGHLVFDRIRAASCLVGWDGTADLTEWCRGRLGEAARLVD